MSIKECIACMHHSLGEASLEGGMDEREDADGCPQLCCAVRHFLRVTHRLCALSLCLLSLRRHTHSLAHIHSTDTHSGRHTDRQAHRQAGTRELPVHTTPHHTTPHHTTPHHTAPHRTAPHRTARRETKTDTADSLEGWTAAEQRAHRPAWRDSSPP